MPTMGDFSRKPVRKWYLKKDFKEEIFRFIDFDVIFCSFKLASQERIKGVDTAARVVSPNVESRKLKNCSRSSAYARTVWAEYPFSNFKKSIKGWLKRFNDKWLVQPNLNKKRSSKTTSGINKIESLLVKFS